MELQIQHLAPYLPYNLYFIMSEGIKLPMSGLKESVIFVHDGYNSSIHYKGARPLLMPLSHFKYDDIDLVKEHIGLGQWCDNYDQYFDIWFENPNRVQTLILQCPYEIIQFFFKRHFDVFGLIEAGLAEEIL
jgi:hypothetical protein